MKKIFVLVSIIMSAMLAGCDESLNISTDLSFVREEISHIASAFAESGLEIRSSEIDEGILIVVNPIGADAIESLYFQIVHGFNEEWHYVVDFFADWTQELSNHTSVPVLLDLNDPWNDDQALAMITNGEIEFSIFPSLEAPEFISNNILSHEEFQNIFTRTAEYLGASVEFFGRVFREPDRDSEGVYIQLFAENNERLNTIVTYLNPDFEVESGDILHIQGVVFDSSQVMNFFGSTLNLPSILATSIEHADFATAFAPALHTVEVNETRTQHNFSITVEKIEIAESETRVHVTANNASTDTVNLWIHSARAVLGNQQLEPEWRNWDANYPELSSDLLPGVKSSGIIVFPPFEGESVTFHLDGSSNDFNIRIEPFVFTIDLN